MEVDLPVADAMGIVTKMLRGGTLGNDLPELLNRIGGLPAADAQRVLQQSRIMVNEGTVSKSFGETVMLMALGRLAELNPESAVQELARLNRMRIEGATVILGRVAAHDPQQAASLLAGEIQDAVGQGSEVLAAHVSGVWGAQDYEGALAWSRGLEGALKGRALAGLVEAAYQKDPHSAWDLVSEIHDPASRGLAEARLFNKMAESDPQGALAYLKSNADDPNQQGRHRILFNQWADRDLAGSVQGLEQLHGPAKQAAAESVMEQWAQVKPADAAQWVTSQPAGTADFSVLSELTTGWGKRDPEAASLWVQDLPPGEQRQGAIFGLVNSQQDRDGASAIAWAEQLTDPAIRKRSLQTSFFKWRRVDGTAARQWLEATESLTKEEKEPLRQSR